jgi:uncharacterized protein YjbI with pentapeptide repeats
MINQHREKDSKEMSEKHKEVISSTNTNHINLRVDCEKCFGLCCVALYFSASEGFPKDKEAGKACINLQSDFRCSIHKNLRKQGLKGCTAYDCFGAGQKVAQVTYSGHDWRQNPEKAEEMFEVFLVMRQLHEMLWYLMSALKLPPAYHLKSELSSMVEETVGLTLLNPETLIELDLAAHRIKVNSLLQQVSELVRTETNNRRNNHLRRQKTITKRLDFIGADLRKTDLRGADLRGAYLIAADLRGADLSGADLIGADLRDTDLRGANLTNSIFLTQAQINAAKGDMHTKLPMLLIRPDYWSK